MSDNWTHRLSEYIDGELTQPERDQLERHLQTCAECGATVKDLMRVAERARSLTDRGPSLDLWAGIAARRPANARRRGFPGPARPDFSRLTFSLPRLAAAAITVAVITGAAVWLGLRGFMGAPVTRPMAEPAVIAHVKAPSADATTPVAMQVSGKPRVAPLPTAPSSDTSFADVRLATAHYEAAISELQRVLLRHSHRLDPRTRQVLAANLKTLDRASTQTKLALRSDPTNVYLYTHLDNTLRRKMQLLRRATTISANSQI